MRIEKSSDYCKKLIEYWVFSTLYYNFAYVVLSCEEMFVCNV